MRARPLLHQCQREVRYRMEVTFRCAITPFVARQNVNVYLLMNVGNMLSAGEPILFLGERPHWKVPVLGERNLTWQQ